MSVEQFDRFKMIYPPLRERKNKLDIAQLCVTPENYPLHLLPTLDARVEQVAAELRKAKEKGAARICVFGAHTIKNGLGPLLGRFVKEGWFTHLATNGAGMIHDWEFAFQGHSGENVEHYAGIGRFGTWQETGLYMNLALVDGAYRGFGYGESIGSLIAKDGIDVPSRENLKADIASASLPLTRRAAAADYLDEIETLVVPSGFLNVKHPFKQYSVHTACTAAKVPFTDHPMFGHDIIYTHKASKGAAIGRTAEVDFLRYVDAVANLENGVILSIGSAVMSPMIFEKALSMARNVLLQQCRDVRHAAIHVFDLQPETWDWAKGEPPQDNPAYYLRFMKTFSRMGCPVDYTSADNRDLLVGLYRKLAK